MDKKIINIFRDLKKMIDKNNLKLKDVFKKFDSDGDHMIDKHEFKTAFNSMNIKLSDDEINYLIKKYDVAQTGELNY